MSLRRPEGRVAVMLAGVPGVGLSGRAVARGRHVYA